MLQTIFEQRLCWSSDECLEAWSKSRSIKNDKCSLSAREEGNALMKVGQWSKALTMYNEAVICASPRSQVLALALANRACAWMKMLQFDHWWILLECVVAENIYKHCSIKHSSSALTINVNMIPLWFLHVKLDVLFDKLNFFYLPSRLALHLL